MTSWDNVISWVTASTLSHANMSPGNHALYTRTPCDWLTSAHPPVGWQWPRPLSLQSLLYCVTQMHWAISILNHVDSLYIWGDLVHMHQRLLAKSYMYTIDRYILSLCKKMLIVVDLLTHINPGRQCTECIYKWSCSHVGLSTDIAYFISHR